MDNIWYVMAGVWFIISIYNYHMLPKEIKDKTNIISFIIFIVISPIVTIGIILKTYIMKNNN